MRATKSHAKGQAGGSLSSAEAKMFRGLRRWSHVRRRSRPARVLRTETVQRRCWNCMLLRRPSTFSFLFLFFVRVSNAFCCLFCLLIKATAWSSAFTCQVHLRALLHSSYFAGGQWNEVEEARGIRYFGRARERVRRTCIPLPPPTTLYQVGTNVYTSSRPATNSSLTWMR